MTKILLLCLFLFSSGYAAFSQGSTFSVSRPTEKATTAPAPKPGYKIRGKWNPNTTPVTYYSSSDSTRYEYDALGNETSLTFYVKEGESGKFYPLTRDENHYDRNNRLLLKTSWGWHGVERKLIETGRFHYTYGSGGAADSVISERKEAATGKWIKGSLQTTKYNPEGEVIEWLFHSRENEKWKPVMGEKYIRTGSTNGVFHEEIYQVYRNTGWSDASRKVHTFTNGRVTERLDYLASGGSWTASARHTNFVYPGATAPENLDVSYIRQVWSNNAWKDAHRYSYYTYPDQSKLYTAEVMLEAGWSPRIDRKQQFNTRGQLTSSITKEVNFHWVKTKTEKFTYDEDGILLEELFYLEDNLQPHTSEYGRYGDFVTFALPTAVPEEKTPLATVYPNPTQHLVFVEPRAASGKLFVVEAMDATGKVLLRQEHREKATLHLGSYPPGLYFIRVAQGDTVQTHKVLRQ